MDRSATAREVARITRKSTLLSVAKAFDKILPDVKKNFPESADSFQKILLAAIKDLTAACLLYLSTLAPGTQPQIPS